MKTKTYEPTGINNFHNSDPIHIRVRETIETHMGALYPITTSQERRIRLHFCGVRDCRCPQGAVQEYEQGKYGVYAKWVS